MEKTKPIEWVYVGCLCVVIGLGLYNKKEIESLKGESKHNHKKAVQDWLLNEQLPNLDIGDEVTFKDNKGNATRWRYLGKTHNHGIRE